jgi:GNAT superfamily N-acetyltransferase
LFAILGKKGQSADPETSCEVSTCVARGIRAMIVPPDLPPFPASAGRAPALPAPNLALRLATLADAPFLLRLFASFRAPGLALLLWPAAQKQAFVESQFALQHTHFVRHHPHGDFWIVARSGAPVGRLYLDRTGAAWRIVDIGLLPGARGLGLGSALIAWLQREAAAAGKPLTLSVTVENPRAHALYRRLGFTDSPPPDGAMRVEMAWQPTP